MKNIFLSVIIAILLFTSTNAFLTNTLQKHAISTSTAANCRELQLKAAKNIALKKSYDAIIATAVVQTAVNSAVPSTLAVVVAKALGYVIAIGSLAVYLPIIYSLLKKKSGE